VTQVEELQRVDAFPYQVLFQNVSDDLTLRQKMLFWSVLFPTTTYNQKYYPVIIQW
jgi:hypothetical protein